MAAAPGDDSIRAVLLDIEGTTTPIDFVFKTLFPYAARQLSSFLQAHADEPGIRTDLVALRAQQRIDAAENLNPPVWADSSPSLKLQSATVYALWLMGRDRKCTSLKSLQGKIWQEGYAKGALHGEVYPDVPLALERWAQEGKIIAIFSSGSVLAQKLLFGNTSPGGDLTGFLHAYFDTTTGPKNEPASYRKIAEALGQHTSNILFISDGAKELDAAHESGMATALCVRDGFTAPVASAHTIIRTFEEIFASS